MAPAEHRKVRVTVSLPAALVREARELAADRGMTLPRLISLVLTEQLETTYSYQTARDRQLRLLQVGLPLGTWGKIPWSREALHER